MKEEIKINEQYIKDAHICWEDDNYGLSFKEYLKGDWEHDPTIGAMIGTNGFSSGPNAEEFEAMTDEEQKAELELRLNIFYDLARKVVGMSTEEFEAAPQK